MDRLKGTAGILRFAFFSFALQKRNIRRCLLELFASSPLRDSPDLSLELGAVVEEAAAAEAAPKMFGV